ncbi:MAG: lysophospholipid acyltransferase family protein [Deltaproteobacteria bacterium]|nr:lysophospholipid acyltransferase family protein [Deltaproteobacteria bacterium]
MTTAQSWRKRLTRWLRDSLALVAAGRAYRLYNKLIRTEFIGWDQVQAWRAKGPVILCHWHGDDLALLGPFGGKAITMMVSRSRDGEMLARMLLHFGYRTARGSSNRGGAQALREMVRVVRAGHDVGLTVDGPLGPRNKVKPGVITLAKLTGAPIFPAGVWTRRKWVFTKTWHQTYIPKPGALVRICFDEPILVPAQAGQEELEAKRLELEAEFFRLHRRARQGG